MRSSILTHVYCNVHIFQSHDYFIEVKLSINISTYFSIKRKTHCTCNLCPVDMVMLAPDTQLIEYGMCMYMWFLD